MAVQSLIYEVDLAWKATRQTGGLPWMPALAESATFRTTDHARVADRRIQPAQDYIASFTASTQPCIALGSLNRVPALIGWGKGGNVTSAGWQVTLV